jgi:hypothetical protein
MVFPQRWGRHIEGDGSGPSALTSRKARGTVLLEQTRDCGAANARCVTAFKRCSSTSRLLLHLGRPSVPPSSSCCRHLYYEVFYKLIKQSRKKRILNTAEESWTKIVEEAGLLSDVIKNPNLKFTLLRDNWLWWGDPQGNIISEKYYPNKKYENT